MAKTIATILQRAFDEMLHNGEHASAVEAFHVLMYNGVSRQVIDELDHFLSDENLKRVKNCLYDNYDNIRQIVEDQTEEDTIDEEALKSALDTFRQDISNFESDEQKELYEKLLELLIRYREVRNINDFFDLVEKRSDERNYILDLCEVIGELLEFKYGGVKEILGGDVDELEARVNQTKKTLRNYADKLEEKVNYFRELEFEKLSERMGLLSEAMEICDDFGSLVRAELNLPMGSLIEYDFAQWKLLLEKERESLEQLRLWVMSDNEDKLEESLQEEAKKRENNKTSIEQSEKEMFLLRYFFGRCAHDIVLNAYRCWNSGFRFLYNAFTHIWVVIPFIILPFLYPLVNKIFPAPL